MFSAMWPISRAVSLAVALAVIPGAAASAPVPQARPAEQAGIGAVLEDARSLEALETVIVARNGTIVAERGYDGHSVTAPTNIKSASKSIVSALVGIAIDKGILEGPDQQIAPLLRRDLPEGPDPRVEQITIGNLLSMQAGLAPTSGPNYGSWIASRNWVRAALSRPFAGEPGGSMLYSTGSTHLLSAILTRKTGRSTLELARDWLGPVEEFRIASWDQDPQGIYFGGNQMSMSPRSLLAFGELYRRGGRTEGGEQVIPAGWIEQSWEPRTNSRFHDDGYGYGWFVREIAGERVHYAWGYGGQMLYIVPALDLTVVMTSDETRPSARTGHRDRLHALMGRIIAASKDDGERSTTAR